MGLVENFRRATCWLHHPFLIKLINTRPALTPRPKTKEAANVKADPMQTEKIPDRSLCCTILHVKASRWILAYLSRVAQMYIIIHLNWCIANQSSFTRIAGSDMSTRHNQESVSVSTEMCMYGLRCLIPGFHLDVYKSGISAWIG